MLGPVLEGDRTRLEPVVREHLPTVAKWRTDLEATRYLLILQFPPSPKQHEDWLEKVAASQDDVVWSVFEKSDGALVGLCGLEKISWRHRHAVGWTFLGEKQRWGRGLGSEAARLRTSFAFSQLGFEKVMTEIYTGNAVSIRMVQRLGFRPAGILRRHRFVDGIWQDLWLGEMLRDEWKG
jgi:[ribosomal protein S5]-alanine N-acetyltransferase